MARNDYFLIVGVAAVGKSTLSKTLIDGGGFRAESAGEAKRKILVDLGIRRDLWSLNAAESLLINSLYFERLNTLLAVGDDNRDELEPLLVDTHATYPLSDGSYANLLPPAALGASGIICLRADLSDILRRRKERGRCRDACVRKWILDEQFVELDAATNFAIHYGVPAYTIDTEAKTPAIVAREARTLIDGWRRND